MSESNVEAVRESYEGPLFSSGYWRMAPNVEFDLTDVFPDWPVIRGIEEMRRFRGESPWGELSFQPERFVDLDDERVLVLVTAHATGKGSGIPLEFRHAHEFTIRDGVLVRFKVSGNHDEALRAAGLSE